jgi:hypothetical protein
MTGRYRIEASGAQGASATTLAAGGRGAFVRGDFALTAGAKLRILVAQQGLALGKGSGTGSGGGGGGSFVVDFTTGKPLIVAGGGGGTRQQAGQNGCDGRTSLEGGVGSEESPISACGPRASGTAGTGGIVSAQYGGSGGGGFTTNGATDGPSGQGGFSFAAGGAGGTPGAGCVVAGDGPGGFGGGGTGNGCVGGGGAGGYSGGDGGFIAGGGGSFDGGVDPVVVAGANSGDGLVTIGLLGDDPCIPAPGSLSHSIAGPDRLYDFCWYLGAPGATCDAVCAEILGTNLAVAASTSFPDSCDAPTAGDVSTWFYNHGNACGWSGTGATGYKTLGYGYQAGAYFGKCAAGASMGNGAFPGDTNNSTIRCVVCPCFGTY